MLSIKRYIVCGVIIPSLLLQPIDAKITSVAYRPVLKGLGLTFPGNYEHYKNFSVTRCMAACSSRSCSGVAWDKATEGCRIYPSLDHVYIEPNATSVATLRNYLPENSPIVFIKVTSTAGIWETAMEDCNQLGGIGVYIPKHLTSEGQRLFDKHGRYWTGLHVIEPEDKWADMKGNVYETSDIGWDLVNNDWFVGPQPSYPRKNQKCGVWWDRPGMHDDTCSKDYIAICDVYGDWKN